MTDFERAAVALTFGLYYGEGVYSSSKFIRGSFKVDMTEGQPLIPGSGREWYFEIGQISKDTVKFKQSNSSQYDVWNVQPISGAECTLMTDENRYKNKILIEKMDRDETRIESENPRETYTIKKTGYREIKITRSDRISWLYKIS